MALGVTEVAAVGLQSHRQGGDISASLPPVESVAAVLPRQRLQPTVERRVKEDFHAMYVTTYVVEHRLLQCPERGLERASERPGLGAGR